MVRCKFYLSEVILFGGGSRKYIFNAQYDSSLPEDQRFAKASPSGRFEIQVDNPAVYDKFEVGKYYYFDVTPVPEVVAKEIAGGTGLTPRLVV